MIRLLANIGITALLILIQPVKLTVSIYVIVWQVCADIGREFFIDLLDVWKRQ